VAGSYERVDSETEERSDNQGRKRCRKGDRTEAAFLEVKVERMTNGKGIEAQSREAEKNWGN